MRRLLLIFLPLIALACATTRDDTATPVRTSERGRYGEQAGTFTVGSIPDVTLRDEARNRDVRFTIDYPITVSEPQPLVIFAPEQGMNNRGYVGLAAYWSSFGYVVVRMGEGDARDVTLVLDSLDRLLRDYPELQGKIDRTKIGVAGQGAGATAAMLLGGARAGNAAPADARVRAIVAMSPAGPGGTTGFTSESFAALGVPALFITGTRDTGANEQETVEWRQQAFRLAPAGDKWLVTLLGAGPTAFGGRAAPPPVIEHREEYDPFTGQRRVDTRVVRAQQAFMDERTQFHLVRSLSLGFWDLYLRGDAAGREYLQRADAREDVTVEQR